MYFYPIAYPYNLEAAPIVSSYQIHPNYTAFLQNPQYCYNQTFLIPVQELLPQQNLVQPTQKCQSTLNQSYIIVKELGQDELRKKKSRTIHNYEPCKSGIYSQKNTSQHHSDRTNVPNIQSCSNRCKFKTESDLLKEQQLDLENDGNNDIPNNYPKKNTQSNVVNQIFSFISTQSKSLEVVKRFLQQDKKKIASFYQILKVIKKRKKKYINRKYLCTLCTIKEKDIGFKMLLRARNKMNVLSVPEFQKILSTLIIYYLKDESEINIITSKKINKSTFMEHLERRREIKNYLFKKFRESAGVLPPSDKSDSEDIEDSMECQQNL